MGQVFSYFLPAKKRKLCDDILTGEDFSIQIIIHSLDRLVNYSSLLDHLQSTNPVMSYVHYNSLYLLYSPEHKLPLLRSNISGDIISSVSAQISRYCVMNKICDPYYIEVVIIVEPHELAKSSLLKLIEKDKCISS
jgi:hypothetical protein